MNLAVSSEEVVTATAREAFTPEPIRASTVRVVYAKDHLAESIIQEIAGVESAKAAALAAGQPDPFPARRIIDCATPQNHIMLTYGRDNMIGITGVIQPGSELATFLKRYILPAVRDEFPGQNFLFVYNGGVRWPEPTQEARLAQAEVIRLLGKVEPLSEEAAALKDFLDSVGLQPSDFNLEALRGPSEKTDPIKEAIAKLNQLKMTARQDKAADPAPRKQVVTFGDIANFGRSQLILTIGHSPMPGRDVYPIAVSGLIGTLEALEAELPKATDLMEAIIGDKPSAKAVEAARIANLPVDKFADHLMSEVARLFPGKPVTFLIGKRRPAAPKEAKANGVINTPAPAGNGAGQGPAPA